MAKVLFAGVLIALTCICGCSPSPADLPWTARTVFVYPAPNTVNLGENDDNIMVNVVNRGTVVVTLAEDTKNLDWALTSTSGRSLRLTNITKHIFTFTAERRGQTVLSFSYGPCMHEKDEAIKTVVFTIIVQTARDYPVP